MVLLERDGQLDQVARAVRLARGGRGSLILVSGPLGSGKSALLGGVPGLGPAGDTRVLRAAGALLERDHGFGVARQLFDPVVSADEKLLTDDVRPVFDGQFAEPSDVVLQGLTELVRAIGEPSLLLVDDLQWVDEPTLRWLTRLARRLDTLPVLVVATVREGDSGAERPLVAELMACSAHVVRPGPLSAAAVAKLITEHTGTVPCEEFTETCLRVSGGNPMFLTSLLHELALTSTAPTDGNADAVRMLRPVQLRERLGHCLRVQSAAVRAFARATAVLGDHTDVELIGHLAGLDAIGRTAAMRTLHRLGLLASPGEPKFAHIVVRDAVEDSMTVPEREELAGRAVRLLHDSGQPAEQVAAQLLGSNARQDEWAIEVLRAAADVALRRGAPEVAARYLRRALLEASPDGEDRARLLIDLAVAERRFDAASSVRHIAYAVPLIESVRDRAAAVVHIAPTQLVPSAGPVREMIERIAHDLGEPAALTGADRELALWLEARLRYLPNPSPVHVRDSLRRLAEVTEQELEETSAGRELLVVLVRETMLGGATSAAEVARIGGLVLDREPATATHVHTALPLLVIALVAADSLVQVNGWLGLALERARGQKLSVEQALIRAEQALVLAHRGRTEEAREAAFEALDMVVLDWGGANSTVAGCLAGVALELREPRLASRIVELWPHGDEDTYENAVCRVLTGSVLETDHERALENLKESGRTLDRGGWRNPVLFPWRLPAALLSARTGHLDAALELAHDAKSQAVTWGAPSGIGRALRTLGQLTPGRAGLDLLRESVAVLEESANALELAKALLRLGTRLREEGHPSAAEHLGRARELARETGAAWLLARTGGDQEHAGAVASLTKAEQRVALLAVAGHTNQEIADQLEVTCRAVEKHLTSCFRKLRIRRRSELSGTLAVRNLSGRAV